MGRHPHPLAACRPTCTVTRCPWRPASSAAVPGSKPAPAPAAAAPFAAAPGPASPGWAPASDARWGATILAVPPVGTGMGTGTGTKRPLRRASAAGAPSSAACRAPGCEGGRGIYVIDRARRCSAIYLRMANARCPAAAWRMQHLCQGTEQGLGSMQRGHRLHRRQDQPQLLPTLAAARA